MIKDIKSSCRVTTASEKNKATFQKNTVQYTVNDIIILGIKENIQTSKTCVF